MKWEERIRVALSKYDVRPSIIKAIADSGYILTNLSPAVDPDVTLCLRDTFYGSKQMSGLFPIPKLLEYLNTGVYSKPTPPRYRIRSITHFEEILSGERHRNWHESGRMTFRGQPGEYFFQRPFPNPYQSGKDGRELLILPSYWRQFRENFNARFSASEPQSIFRTSLGDSFIYHGIDGWQTLGEKNFERYGLHSLSDLADFPDPESKEYYRRWWMFKSAGGGNPDIPLVEQHYGIDTHGLDVTFEPAIALFFATHRFTLLPNGTATYRKIEGKHEGVVYSFVFHSPAVRLTSDLITKIESFEHIPAMRPLRQKCALRGFDAHCINEAVADIDAVFEIADDFEFEGLPPKEELFPNRKDDPLYSALLDAKKRFADIKDSPFVPIVEYAF